MFFKSCLSEDFGLDYTLLTSKTNDKLKRIRRLEDRKHRRKERLFVFEGAHLLEEYVRAGNTPVEIFVCDDVAERYAPLIESSGCTSVYAVPRDVYKSLSAEQAPQGVLSLCSIERKREGVIPEQCTGAMLLESVRDAGNLGTIIRTAASLGIDKLFISEDCADLYNSKTVRATMGALFFSNITVVPDLCDVAEKIKAAGARLFATLPSEGAKVLGEFEVLPTDCFAIGNEGGGLSDELISACTDSAVIPMSGRTESLNAAAAATVFLWEMARAKK